MKHYDPTVYHGRVVLIGDASVGKTSILNRLIEDRYDELEAQTIGANYQLFTQEIDSSRVEMQLWDTAGQEKFRSLIPVYYRNAIAAVAVYDVSNMDSFSHLSDWIEQFQNEAGVAAVVFVVGNKTDLVDDRQVKAEDTESWAHARNYSFFECSAKSGDGVKHLFEEMAKAIVVTKEIKFENPKPNPKQGQSSCC